jgi:hypothetical protein
MAAFIPGASPPDVTIPMVFANLLFLFYKTHISKRLKCLVWHKNAENSKTHKFFSFVFMVFVGR